MRSIILILALIFPSLISEARADGCQAALARYNKAVIAEGAGFIAEFQKAMGVTPAAYFAAHGKDNDTATIVDLCTKTASYTALGSS
jgi:hypothetical protein